MYHSHHDEMTQMALGMQYALELRRRGVVPQIEGGLEARNEVGDDAGHEWVLGPALALELPIFNPGHADFARLRAYLRQAQHRLEDAILTMQHYNAMLIGTYRLLETRADQIETRRAYVDALHDYWVARSELELATGGRLPEGI